MPGWTLTVDLPIEDGLERLCNQLDELVVAAGGRVYLAKDSRLGCGHVPADVSAAGGLPRRSVDAVDPDHLFTSDLARRLRL